MATSAYTAVVSEFPPRARTLPADVLERVVSGRTKAHELETLLPWNWAHPARVELAAAA